MLNFIRYAVAVMMLTPMRIGVCATTVALLSVSSSFAQVSTIGDAMGRCTNAHRQGNINLNSGQEAYNIGTCVGVAKGVAWVMMSNCNIFRQGTGTYELGGGLRAAPPIGGGAAWQAFKSWAEDHPELWSESFSFGMIQALNENMPCDP
jgi:hypothetical protein